jgi:DNA (cytosine-5)-methyltransferase 1
VTAYYNEIDPYCAAWLRNLIAAGHIAQGDVDERSIEDVVPSDLAGYTQCHFFAGIGIWSLALRSAGVPDDYPVWTGSCPCQPFSAAGKGAGFTDERHLWPAFHHLIRVCRPPEVIGEQVASKDGLGWLELVQADLEGEGYTFGAADLCAAGFASSEGDGRMGGAHIRQRLYWGGKRLGYADHAGSQGRDGGSLPERPGECAVGSPSTFGWLADTQSNRHERGGELREPSGRPGVAHSGAVDWLPCRDGKYRPVEGGTFPLAHEDPQRVGRLRAYGNALDAATAQAFVEAFLETTP